MVVALGFVGVDQDHGNAVFFGEDGGFVVATFPAVTFLPVANDKGAGVAAEYHEQTVGASGRVEAHLGAVYVHHEYVGQRGLGAEGQFRLGLSDASTCHEHTEGEGRGHAEGAFNGGE